MSAADDYDPKARQAIFGLFAVAGGMGYLILPRAQVSEFCDSKRSHWILR